MENKRSFYLSLNELNLYFTLHIRPVASSLFLKTLGTEKRLPSRNRVASSRVWFHRLDYFYPTGQARGSMQYSNEEACIAFATFISFLHHIMVRCYISHFISIEPSHTSNAFSACVVFFGAGSFTCCSWMELQASVSSCPARKCLDLKWK